MSKDKKKLSVSAIKNGTVIDHIPAKSLFNVISILGLNNIEEQVSFGSNYKSKLLGNKGIIKISNIFFDEHEINKIALIAPHAKLNIIKDYKVVEKKVVKIPENIKGIVKCFNPNCVTNNEKITTFFTKVSKNKGDLKCHYCEKITEHANIVIS